MEISNLQNCIVIHHKQNTIIYSPSCRCCTKCDVQTIHINTKCTDIFSNDQIHNNNYSVTELLCTGAVMFSV